MIVSRIWRKVVSEFVRLRHYSVIKAGPKCRLAAGLRINNLDISAEFKDKRLSVVLEGMNGLLHGVVIQGTGVLSMGRNSYIGEYSIIGCNERIEIGRDVMIAQSVSIRDTDHVFVETNKPMNQQGIITAPIIIEDNVWIGHGATILKGVRVGTGSVIAAGAVVIRDVEAFSVVGGVPAKKISSRLEYVTGQSGTEEAMQ